MAARYVQRPFFAWARYEFRAYDGYVAGDKAETRRFLFDSDDFGAWVIIRNAIPEPYVIEIDGEEAELGAGSYNGMPYWRTGDYLLFYAGGMYRIIRGDEFTHVFHYKYEWTDAGGTERVSYIGTRSWANADFRRGNIPEDTGGTFEFEFEGKPDSVDPVTVTQKLGKVWKISSSADAPLGKYTPMEGSTASGEIELNKVLKEKSHCGNIGVMQ